jgi:FkbM family methyltransferase
VTTSYITHDQLVALLGRRDPTILEIGCNDGTDTLKFLDAAPRAAIYCFEPDPRPIKRFKERLRDSPVKLFELAISNQSGQATFHMSTDDKGGEHGFDQSGSIRKPKNHLLDTPWVKFEKDITVVTSTLDQWCKENNVSNIDLIWMDVQGAERDVIEGGINALRQTRYLYTEYSNNELYEGQWSLKELLRALPNFDVVARYPGDILLRNTELAQSP